MYCTKSAFCFRFEYSSKAGALSSLSDLNILQKVHGRHSVKVGFFLKQDKVWGKLSIASLSWPNIAFSLLQVTALVLCIGTIFGFQIQV